MSIFCCHFTSASPGVSASQPLCFSLHIHQGCFALTCSSVNRRAFETFQRVQTSPWTWARLSVSAGSTDDVPGNYRWSLGSGRGLPLYVLRIQKLQAGQWNKQWWNWKKRDAAQGMRKLGKGDVDMWLKSVHPSIHPSAHPAFFHHWLFFTLSFSVSRLLKGDSKEASNHLHFLDNWQALVTPACIWTHTHVERANSAQKEPRVGAKATPPCIKTRKAWGPNKTFSRICLYFLKYFWPHLTTLPKGRQPSPLQQCLSLEEPFFVCLAFASLPSPFFNQQESHPDCPTRAEMLIGY